MSTSGLPFVIGFAGVARSGKSTLAHYLTANYGYTPIGFADGVRATAERLNVYFPEAKMSYVEAVESLGHEGAKMLPEVRRHLVDIGDGLRQTIHPDVWVWRADSEIMSRTIDGEHRFVFTDVRYVNEARFIKQMGGYVVMLDRPGVNAVHPAEERSIRELRDSGLISRWLYNGSTLDMTVALFQSYMDEWVKGAKK